MRRFIFSGLLFTNVLLANSDVCPDLSKKSQNIEESKGIKEALIGALPNAWMVYSESLMNYNKTDDIEQYIATDTLSELGVSIVWGELLRIRYEISTLIDTHKYTVDSEQIKKLENEYKRLINKIEPKNSNWCNELASKEIKKFMKIEIESRVK